MRLVDRLITPGRSLALLASIGAGLLVLLAGALYTAVRTPEHRSEAKVVLEPEVKIEGNISANDIFVDSGTLGTFVELLSWAPVLDTPRYESVHVKARAIVDPTRTGSRGNTRIIRVIGTSAHAGLLQPALRSLLASADRRQASLGDVWRFKTIQDPSSPTASAPTRKALVAGSVLLALLAGVIVWTFFPTGGSLSLPGSRSGRRGRFKRSATAG